MKRKDYKKIAYRLARKLDQVMCGLGGANDNLMNSSTWRYNADQLILAAGIKPGSSKRYSPTQDKGAS